MGPLRRSASLSASKQQHLGVGSVREGRGCSRSAAQGGTTTDSDDDDDDDDDDDFEVYYDILCVLLSDLDVVPLAFCGSLRMRTRGATQYQVLRFDQCRQ